MGKNLEEKNISLLLRLGRLSLTLIALLFLILFLFVPLVAVFAGAFEKGWDTYLKAIAEPDVMASIKLTLLVALIVVPINVVFGLISSWLITRFKFRGKGLLLTILEIPLAVSPVIAGMVFILLYGSRGLFAPLLEYLDLKIVFAFPGIVLATIFVTMPYVARELIPVMEERGVSEEEASLSMGASGFRTFWSVTIPNIKWGLLYGIILCNARAMGEFGAVSVVSGHIRGVTNTMPLEVQVLYNEYNFTSAFAVSSLLAMLALLTLILKSILEWKCNKE